MGMLRRGGTLSLVGVYIGPMQMFPLGDLFDKQITIRQGQANVRRWTDDLMPLVEDEADPLRIDDLVTHRFELDEAPLAYELFQKKKDGIVKPVLIPH
jgi:threonine dehydrogenase-like Zn-dependent dehydrogenase